MSTIANLTKQLENTRRAEAKLAAELAQAQKQLAERLAGLPKELGFESVDEVIKALLPLASPVLKGNFGAVAKKKPAATKAVKTGKHGAKSAAPVAAEAASTPAKSKPVKKKKQKRATITPEVKEALRALVLAKKTGSEIAAELNISIASVHNIKKELGLIAAKK